MPVTADPAESSRQALAAALLDYSQAPGRYQVRLRQPQVLFAAMREVLQIAVGREGEAVAGGAGQTALLRDAARFFVRAAMLFPGADHYALLAIDRTVDTPELKDRYRLMMRLLHPDFSGADSGQWPADAAVRVNRAYDVLSSPVQRREYDERLGLEQVPGASQMSERRPAVAVRAAADDDSRRASFKTLAAVFALAGIALVIVSLYATGSSDSVQLVQRSPGQVEATQLATQESAVQPQAKVFIPAPRKPQAAEAPLPVRPAPVPSVKPEQAVLASVPPPVRTPAISPEPVLTRPLPSPVLDRATVLARPISVPPSVQSPIAEAKPEIAPSVSAPPAPVIAAPLSLPATALASSLSVQPVSIQRPTPRAGPTLTEAQPLLAQLLQLMESGRGERILNLLDAEARNKPSAQALSRQYDTLVDGARPVRLSHVEFKAEPGDGRLFVVGQFRVLAGEQTIGAMGKKMVLRAEFVSRDGNVVITGLSGGPVN